MTEQQEDPIEQLLNVTQVATWLGVPRGWVYQKHGEGVLKGGMLGKHLRFRRSDIQAYLDEQFSRG